MHSSAGSGVNLEGFVAERGEYWAELEGLVDRSGGQGRKLSPEEIYRLADLYRSAAADLAVARRSWPDTSGTLRLQALVTRANAVVYAKPAREDTAVEFLSVRIWREDSGARRVSRDICRDLVRLRGARGPVGLRRALICLRTAPRRLSCHGAPRQGRAIRCN